MGEEKESEGERGVLGEEDRGSTKGKTGRERQCGRQEGNVTRQGGDMEHRITV